MITLKTTKYINNSLVTSYGVLKFDKNGMLIEPKELMKDFLEELSSFEDFELVVSKPEEKVIEDKPKKNPRKNTKIE